MSTLRPVKVRKPYRNGKVHVCRIMCASCIFRPGNLMHLEDGRLEEMVAGAKKEQSCIVCHETLNELQAVCRGFFEHHRTGPLQIAERLMLIELQ